MRGKQEIDFDRHHEMLVTDGTTSVTALWEPFRPGSWYYGETASGNAYRLPEGYRLVKDDEQKA